MRTVMKKILVLLIMSMIVNIFQIGEVFAKPKYNCIWSFHEGMATIIKKKCKYKILIAKPR